MESSVPGPLPSGLDSFGGVTESMVHLIERGHPSAVPLVHGLRAGSEGGVATGRRALYLVHWLPVGKVPLDVRRAGTWATTVPVTSSVYGGGLLSALSYINIRD
jgi:hypothetical protein